VADLEPLLPSVAAAPQATEIYVTPFLPDAAEALIQSGRHSQAEPLIEALESNGRRLDRPWMLACGGRCRALLLAERGDLAGATEAVQRALAEHDRLPMPFERARTLLVLGQLQRRQRHRTSALETVQRAATEFEAIGAALWAEQARRTANRIDPRSHPDQLLTASEYEIAELVASGMSNREVGAALFVSAKTVEVHLSRIYRKLGIRSRSELGWRIARPQT
jgi:DNA-binding CsgD family transcriptional regulator